MPNTMRRDGVVGQFGRRSFVFGVAGGSLSLLSGCDVFGRDRWEWHQKLTLVVRTPDGVVSGGSVVRVRAASRLSMQGGERLDTSVKGEASVVEVAPGRYLFALLVDEGGSDTLIPTMTARTFPEQPDGTVESRLSLHETRRETRPVPLAQPDAESHTPLLITFRDPSDPKSVEIVDPNDLAATFGEGYALEAMTLSLIDGPASERVLPDILPWIDDKKFDKQNLGDVPSIKRNLPLSLHTWAFRST